MFEGLDSGKEVCEWVDFDLLLGCLGVVVKFLLCTTILKKLVKQGGGRVGVGDVGYRCVLSGKLN